MFSGQPDIGPGSYSGKWTTFSPGLSENLCILPKTWAKTRLSPGSVQDYG